MYDAGGLYVEGAEADLNHILEEHHKAKLKSMVSSSHVSVCTCNVPKYTWLTYTKAFCHTCEKISG